MQKQNAEIVSSIKGNTEIPEYAKEANPFGASELILRVSYRKDPLYRHKISHSKSEFFKYEGYIIAVPE